MNQGGQRWSIDLRSEWWIDKEVNATALGLLRTWTLRRRWRRGPRPWRSWSATLPTPPSTALTRKRSGLWSTRWKPSNGPAAEATGHNYSLVVTRPDWLWMLIVLLFQEAAVLLQLLRPTAAPARPRLWRGRRRWRRIGGGGNHNRILKTQQRLRGSSGHLVE